MVWLQASAHPLDDGIQPAMGYAGTLAMLRIFGQTAQCLSCREVGAICCRLTPVGDAARTRSRLWPCGRNFSGLSDWVLTADWTLAQTLAGQLSVKISQRMTMTCKKVSTRLSTCWTLVGCFRHFNMAKAIKK